MHPKKSRTRPLAAGTVSKKQAINLGLFLCLILVVGYFVQPEVVQVIIVYLLLNIAYTLKLKTQPVVDIFSIAFGFVLRVYAGGSALGIPVSSWMFVTTLCLALYLAAIKRRQELLLSGEQAREVLGAYSVALVERYAEMAGTAALVFYSLFIMNVRPELIATIPLVLFGLFRYWYLVDLLDKGESPTETLLSDWPLIIAIVTWGVATAWILKA